MRCIGLPDLPRPGSYGRSRPRREVPPEWIFRAAGVGSTEPTPHGYPVCPFVLTLPPAPDDPSESTPRDYRCCTEY